MPDPRTRLDTTVSVNDRSRVSGHFQGIIVHLLFVLKSWTIAITNNTLFKLHQILLEHYSMIICEIPWAGEWVNGCVCEGATGNPL